MKPRPLSPHLQIYRPQITSVLSILHRFSGIGLFIALLFVVIGLGCLATGERAFQTFQDFFSGIVGKMLLFLSLLGFYYHFANGIRHLAWDSGYGFELTTVEKTGWFVIAFTIGATLITWILF
jgi:succinate dehydrogenase / fumarate reductase cytochrome b subunit